MRITSQMTQANSLYRLSSNYSAVAKTVDQISSLRTVLNVSDNPSAAVNGLKLNSMISRTQQYSTNIKTGLGTLTMADVQLGSAKSILDEIKTLVTQAATATSADGRQAIATQVGEALNQLLMYANAHDGERYIFGGTYTASQPFTTVGNYILYNGNSQSIHIQTGLNNTSAINCTGTDAFGNMTNTVGTGSLTAGINMCTDVSTSLDSLNNGNGVPKGKIVVYYSSYPEGLEVDLSGCDTLEDVKDAIELATLEASRALDPKNCSWLDGGNLDWHDLTDRYVEVTMNPDGTGISLREIDLGEPLPAPTASEAKKGLDYSGNPGYTLGGGGTGVGAGAIYDKDDYIYSDGTTTYAPLSVDNTAGGSVASSLGIKGTANYYDQANADPVMDGYIHGTALNPIITSSTLLADLEGYNDAVYTITNGDKPGSVTIRETSSDANSVFNDWNLSNLSQNYNTGSNGELYARVTRRGAPDNDIYVELYAVPLDQAKAGDLVAAGACDTNGGTVELHEANGSGVTGTVGIVLGTNVDSATVDLQAEFGSGYQAVVSVPAFVEEKDAKGLSLDTLNLLSGWNITGLDKPPAEGYNLNHPASTDPDGNLRVSLREVDNGDGTSSLILELYRPAYGDQPETLVATGELNLGGQPPLDTAASGRIAITGVEGFEAISGSVYVELPAGETGTDLSMGLTATFATVEDLMRAVEEAGVYTSVNISEDGKSLEFSSQLAGAYLTVSEDTDCYEQMGDAYQQLSALDLNGLVKGVNADASGNVYTEVVYYPPDASRTDGKALLIADDGTQTLIDAGYYVRVYSDSSALTSSYENRDNSSLVAEGFIPAGEWVDPTDPSYDPANPFAPIAPATAIGSASPLILEERNGSGMSGTVSLDYYGNKDQAELQPDGSYSYAPYDNSDITVRPGGLRTNGSAHTVLQEVDVSGFVPGVHSDYSGAAHGTISYDAVADVTTVSIYKDTSHTHMTAKGEINAATGEVILYETDKSGNYALDANGDRIVVGSLVVADNTLLDGSADNFSVTLGGVGGSGQDRESNIFSTITDVINALNANDEEALHNLIDTLAADIDRLLAARSDIGARSSRLELLSERYLDDIVVYQSMLTANIGMDSDALAMAILNGTAAENAYSASMQVASRYLQMSLLDYL